MILELLRRRGVRGGRGAIFEFTGPGVASLSYTERGTIANMIAELGATGAVFPADDETRGWMTEQQRADEFVELATGDTGDFDEEEHIDLAELVPLVAKPSSPGNVVPVEEVAGTELTQVCIGSSVNSSYADLALCGAVMRGAQISEKLVSATATPGSRQILDQITRSGTYVDLLMAGLRMLEPACGPCVGMGQAPPSGSNSLRTFNRNFPGRSGTADDQVFLCSPAVAAASMLTGVISDPRELPAVDVPERPAARPEVVQAHILEPVPADEASSIEIPRGPNIKPPPEAQPLPEELKMRVLIKAPDDISTGDLSPDGATVMAYRSNVPAIAEFTFQLRDPEFPRRAHEWGGGFIVAGHNYGQGSSREHAALAPLQLGVRAVIAKSFARIHRRNLIAQGIVPLLFKDENDYDKAGLGQTWRITGLRAIAEGEDELETEIEGADTITLTHDLLPREREIVVAGGLIRYLREQQPAPRPESRLGASTARGSSCASAGGSTASCQSAARSSRAPNRSSRRSASPYFDCAFWRCLPTTSKSVRNRSKSCPSWPQ